MPTRSARNKRLLQSAPTRKLRTPRPSKQSYWRQNIKIEEDPELPQAKLISIGDTDPAIIGQLRKTDGQSQDGVQRVHVQGRVYRVAKQSGLMFARLRRGLDLIQRLYAGNLAKTYDALTLARETSMEVFGELREVPAGLRAPLDRELHGNYFRTIAKAPGGDETFATRVPDDGDFPTLLNVRHLALRQDKPSAVMFIRDVLESASNTV